MTKAVAWGISALASDEDVDSFLTRPDIDPVEILMPHHLHLPVASKAMAASAIFSLQPPMCLKIDKGRPAGRLSQSA